MAEASDDILLARFASGDDRAFTEIYNRYKERIYFTCLKYIHPMGKAEDAQEIVNMTFLKLYERRDKMISLAAITRFLHLALRSGSIDFLRKAGRSVESSRDVSELQAANDELDAAFLERVMQEEAVLEMVKRLPERSKEVVVMYYLEGLKYKDIGDKLNISPRTVENQLRYALNKLRVAMLNRKAAGMVMVMISALIGSATVVGAMLLIVYVSEMLPQF